MRLRPAGLTLRSLRFTRRSDRLDQLTGGAPTRPLVLLSLLFFFDEFDSAAFHVLAPNIKAAFELSTEAFALVVIINLTIVLGLAVPLGHFSDRLPRTRVAAALGVLAGVCSLLTGTAVALGALVVYRLGNGLGRLANDTVHPSLLADYYAPKVRPQVFGWHRNAVYLGAIAGSAVAGVAAAVAGWRWAFFILVVPIVVCSVAAARLPEPRRGATDDPGHAGEAEREEPVPLREAARTLLSVRTLRRQYWAWVFVGAGVVPLAYLLPLYLEHVYGLGDWARGTVVAANAACTFAGVVVATRWTHVWFAREMGEPLKRAGLALVALGVGLALVAAAPWMGLAIAFGLATSFAAGVFYPPFHTVQALVSPARVRTLSFAFGALFLVAGVWLLYILTGVAAVADDHGYRWGLGVLLPFWIIGGLVLRSGHRFVADDAARALRTLAATADIRRQRLSAGERSLLRCVSTDVAYDSVQVLFGVDFDVREGEIVALLGTNGAGKSTLLKAISGLVEPIGGSIFFDGDDITHKGPQESAGLGIIQMPGGRSIFPTLTVRESLRLAGWMYRRQDPEHVRAATKRVNEFFPVLESRADQLAGDLSGGEQQMLGLAMAFIARPRLLMIDELTLGLAPTIVGRLVDIVRAIHEQGATVILVEQSVNTALLLADRAVFLEKGEVRFTGPTADLLERDDVLRSVFLGAAADAAARRGDGNGRAPATAARRAHESPETALELREVVRRFGGIRAVDGVSLQLADGEILGLIGPNGAGKTTVFDLISGFQRADEGRIILRGRDVTSWSPDRRARAGLGRSFQDARLFPSLTVAENIALGLERHLEVRDPLAAMLGMPEVGDSESEAAWRVHELIELLGLGAYRNKFVSELSTGTRRVVDLAMAIGHDPKVLLLDEPSSGIAQRETEALGPLLLRIKEETGCSLIVIEHDMPLVTTISDRMLALELGAVIAEGSPEHVVNHPAVVASYLGSDATTIARSGSRPKPRRGRAAVRR